MKLPGVILGIETSCDETAAALLVNGKIVADRTTRQVLHELYGGVVPELASRAHEQLLAPAVRGVLDDAGLTPGDVEAVAVTFGPGLAGALLVGLSFAKGFAAALGIPFWAVNHLEGHLWIARLTNDCIETPALGLIVSGGHTLLLRVQEYGSYMLLGSTRDDAVGELFDKVGRLLGFTFPAGAAIDSRAMAFTGKPVLFPVSRVKNDPTAFSFSGIKTAVRYYLQRNHSEKNPDEFDLTEDERSAICAGLMSAVSKSLKGPIERALEGGEYKSLIVSGGVSASKYLRKGFSEIAETYGVPLIIPPFHHCTDNGAMIAYAGAMMIENGRSPAKLSLEIDPSARLYRTSNLAI